MLPPGMLPAAHQLSCAHQVLLPSFLHAMFQNPLTFLYCLCHQCLQSISWTWKSPMRTNSTPPPETLKAQTHIPLIPLAVDSSQAMAFSTMNLGLMLFIRC